MLDMFEGEGAKRAPGDLNFGKRFLPEDKVAADELATKEQLSMSTSADSEFGSHALTQETKACGLTITSTLKTW